MPWPDYPGERLLACRNPELAKLRAYKRQELLAATGRNLDKIKARVDTGKLTGQDEIGLRVGKVVNQYEVAKHFELTIGARAFTFRRKLDGIAAEAALDDIYIIRTFVPAAQMDAAQCVRNYKSLAKAARHTLDDGTPAHSFATLLAELATIVRNTCRTPGAEPDAPTFEVLTTPNAKQQRALELIQQLRLLTETGPRISPQVPVIQGQTRPALAGTSV